jgi:hypothetical protein
VELRADAGLTVRPETDRDLVALRPLAAEQARSADRTEGLHASVVGREDTDELLTGEEPEALARDPSLRAAERAGVLAAARAVAVIRPEERRRHLEADAAAEARPLKRVPRAWLDEHVWWQLGHPDDELTDKAALAGDRS